MSKILRRPMFRGGGKVSSYGKGITTGLTNGYAGGGQIGGGYIHGAAFPDGRYGFKNPSTYSQNWKNIDWKNAGQNVKNTGQKVVEAAKNKVAQGASKTTNFLNKVKKFKIPTDTKLAQGIGKYAKKGFNLLPKQGLMFRNPVSTTLAAYYGGSTPTPIDKKYGLDNRYQTSGLSSMLDSEFEGSTLQKKFKRNLAEEANPNNLYRYNKYKHGPRKEHPLYDPEKISWNPWNKGAAETDLTPKPPTGIIGPPGGGDPEMKYDAPDPAEVAELTMKQQVAKDKALFADLLGEGEARGKDVSDMLLRFAGSGGNTVGEKFQQYIGAEAQAGPSRTEKINQAAASLAINDYISGKRSKENMEMMLKKTEHNVDYTIDAQKAAKDITSMDFQEALTAYSQNITGGKKDRLSDSVIKGVLSIQMPGKQINSHSHSNKTLSEISDMDAKKFDIGLNIVTYKGGKIILERVGETISEVPNLHIT